VASVSDQAIVLRRWEWSETSQIVALFLREHGVLRGVAKGARREKAPFSGGFEPLTRGNVVAYPRRSSSLATLAEWDLQQIYWGPRQSLRAHYMGLYAADLALHMMAEADPHPHLFDALADALNSLSGAPSDARNLLEFQWEVLVESGHRLDLADPEHTGRSRALGLDLDAGRLVADPGPEAAFNGVWRVRKETIHLLRRIEQGAVEDPSENPAPEASDVALERANRLLGAYCARIVGKAPPSARMAISLTDGGAPDSRPRRQGR
jgi:DNA repair protein RecO (recombination protein O)